ncbi:glycine cleavage system aminomethyltransferase GcvT [Salinispirillum sp. LH 10-3-1]|uniref:Aminomethyltransferase n=1 Tax=Salinispirillum sp. LH 10-3-1 TaxID=2952525 RepID=A0AB38YHS4_9GAMM
MNRTPLYDFHLRNGAKMVAFHGWEMPIHYGSQLDEHQAVRQSSGLFDVSHMTVVDISGEDAERYLQRLLANDVAKLTVTGKALYSAMLNDDGGVIDDLICYRRDKGYRLVVNSATRKRDLAWMTEQAGDANLGLQERPDLAMIAVQGPVAIQQVAQALPQYDTELAVLKPFHALESDTHFIARTGYTGEDGVEIILPLDAVEALAQELVEAGAKPCGLGARDTLRLEAGMNLYGSDMDEQVSPLSCGMAWTLDWSDQRDFIGRAALERLREAGDQPQQAGLILEGRGIMRAGQTVHFPDGQHGIITSGTFSPTLQKSIAFARIPRGQSGLCNVDVRGKALPARIVKLPFVRQGQPVVE